MRLTAVKAMDLTDNTPLPAYCDNIMSSGQLPTLSGGLLLRPVRLDLKEITFDFIFMYVTCIFIVYYLLFVATNVDTHTHTHTDIYIYIYLFIYKFPVSKNKSAVSKIPLHCMSPECPSMSVWWLDYIKKKRLNNDSSTKLYACDRQKLYSLVLLRILAVASF